MRNLRQRSFPAFVLAIASVATTLSAQLTFAPLNVASNRVEQAFVFDEARGVMLRFGGSVGTTFFNDTWQFDGTNWQQLSPSTSPTPRGRPACTYDPVRREVVVFGGVTTGGTMLNDTWVWNGSTWAQVLTPTAPSPRSGAAMAFDPSRQECVLFGGWVPSGLDTNDTWRWNGQNWTLVITGPGPQGRGAHRMVYHDQRQALVMFGGWRTPNNGTVGDTWELRAGWTQITGPGPSNRCDPSMQFDPVRGRMVLFGGLTAFSGSTPILTGDTWEYGGGTPGWQQRQPTTPPSARAYAEMVWDAPRSRLVLHGGMDSGGARGDTFALTRANPASALEYGAACASSVGNPAMEGVPFALPWLGDTFIVRVAGGVPASAPVLLWFGSSRTTWNGANLPLPLDALGLTGCLLHAAPDISLALTLSGGQATLSASLCGNCPSFAGRRLFFQALVLDQAAPRSFPAALTNGLELTIGRS
jgi:hypothetical protein